MRLGQALDSESTGSRNRRFTSYDRSSVTSLDYAINRHYDSQQGRFTQVDPIGMGSVSLTSPQTLNLYAYCVNDPINHADPSGLGLFSFLRKAFKWIGIAVSIALIALSIVGLTIVLPALSGLGLSGLASAATWASIGMLVTGALGLVSQFVPGKIGFIAGLTLLGLNVYNAINSFLQTRSFGFYFQGQCPPDCAGQIFLPPVSAGNIYAHYTIWERLWGVTKTVGGGVWTGYKGLATFMSGYNEQAVPVARHVRHLGEWATGIHVVDENSGLYGAGGWSQIGADIALGGEAILGEEGLNVAGRIALDKPHLFRRLGGRWSHLQLDLWRAGIKNSDFLHVRVPLFVNASKRWAKEVFFRF